LEGGERKRREKTSSDELPLRIRQKCVGKREWDWDGELPRRRKVRAQEEAVKKLRTTGVVLEEAKTRGRVDFCPQTSLVLTGGGGLVYKREGKSTGPYGEKPGSGSRSSK